jgi:hypothetical protein
VINIADVPLRDGGNGKAFKAKVGSVSSRFDWSNPKAGGIRYVGRTENSLNHFDGEE